MESELLINMVIVLIGLLFIAAVSAFLLKRIRFPFTVGLVLIGVVIAFAGNSSPELQQGIDALEIAPELIMFVFIPTLIFESAVNIDVRLLLKNLVPTLTLAVPGLLLSTFLIGFLVSWTTALPLGSALIFGCLISATDPVAVIALFKDIGAPKRLNILMEGESLFNDATAIVTFQIILGVIATGILDTETILNGIAGFFNVFFSGLIVGLGFGYILARFIRFIGDEPLVHVVLTFVVAYGSFIVAEHYLHTSGIMAVLGAGLMVGYYGSLQYPHRVKEYLESFWETAAFIANSFIFLMLGLSEKTFLTNVGSNPTGLLLPILIVIVIVLIVRAVVVFGMIPAVNRIPGQRLIDKAYQAILYWGGLRGAVAVALAISLPATFAFRWQIIDLAFGITLFTLLVNGTTMSWLMRRLKFDKPSPVVGYVESYVNVLAKKAAVERLSAENQSSLASPEVKARVHAQYEAEYQQAKDDLKKLQQDIADQPDVRQKLMWLDALSIQRQLYTKRYDDGVLSISSLRELEWDLRDQEMIIDAAEDITQHQNALPNILTMQKIRFMPLLSDILPKLKIRGVVETYEEIVAVLLASEDVLAKQEQVKEFADVSDEDLVQLVAYYKDVQSKAQERLTELEQTYETACIGLKERELQHYAKDGEHDVIKGLAISGALPELITDRLEQVLKA